ASTRDRLHSPSTSPSESDCRVPSVAVGAHPEPEPSAVFSPASPRYINRELSRLDFDERVLAMAEDPKLPVLERVRFLAIFSQNLDDFFHVRVDCMKGHS